MRDLRPDQAEPVWIRVVEAPAVPEVVRGLRAATDHSVAVIREAIRAQHPLIVGHLFGLDHDASERRILSLLDHLDRCRAVTEISFEGETVGRDRLETACREWHEIGEALRREDELRQEPSGS